MLLVALLINNIQRVFPTFWWTPCDVGKKVEKDEERNWDGDGDGDAKGKKENVGRIEQIENAGFKQMIVLSGSGVVVPEGFALGLEEEQILEDLRNRLKQRGGVGEGQQEGDRTFVSGSESDTTHVDYRGR